MAVRRGAALETPHVMMLADDPGCTLIEPIGEKKEQLRKVYEGDLMLNGGHIAGWAVEDPALIAQIEDALAVLGSQEEFDKKYPDATRRDPLTLAVGDGNHSLATAKACWEELEKDTHTGAGSKRSGPLVSGRGVQCALACDRDRADPPRAVQCGLRSGAAEPDHLERFQYGAAALAAASSSPSRWPAAHVQRAQL